jgi:cytochrome c556
MNRSVLVGLGLVTAITTALAQSADPIVERKNLMKGNGAAAKIGTQMAKGEMPFDLGTAHLLFSNFEGVGRRFYTLFPETSRSGGDTAAAPKIWEDMAGFRAASEKLAADAQSARLQVKDAKSFKAAFGEVAKNCNACHQTYRINKT